ncbi:hypothetical protein D3C78_1576630 [compost metagenome]
MLDPVPGGEDRHRGEDQGEHGDQQREAVDADVVVDAEGGQPAGLFSELEARLGLETEPEAQSQRQVEKAGAEGPDFDHRLPVGGDEQHAQARQGRKQDENRE